MGLSHRVYPMPDLADLDARLRLGKVSHQRMLNFIEIQRLRVHDVVRPEFASYHKPEATRWFYDLEEEVRERIMPPPLRPGVYAEW